MSHAAQLELLASAYEVLGMPSIVAAVKAGAAKLRESGDTGVLVPLEWKRLPSSALIAWSRDGRRVVSVMKAGEAFRVRIEDARSSRVDHESNHSEEPTAMATAIEVLGTLE